MHKLKKMKTAFVIWMKFTTVWQWAGFEPTYSDETEWMLHWNKKIYESLPQAEDAVSQMKKNNIYTTHVFKIVPIEIPLPTL